mgnify:CR=1 FL=1
MTKFESMNYAELRKEAAARKIKFIGVTKEALIAALVEFERANAEVNRPALEEGLSTSEKIRRLTAAGMSRKEIAQLLGVRYQFVRNVQMRATEKTA